MVCGKAVGILFFLLKVAHRLIYPRLSLGQNNIEKIWMAFNYKLFYIFLLTADKFA